MNRQEFVAELRRAMSGSFSTAEIEDTAAYYEDYITMQIKKGKSEEEVLRELGSPRLIAKSMKAAGGNAAGSAGGNTDARRSTVGGAGRTAGSGAPYDEDVSFNGGMHMFRLPMWLVLLVVLLILLAVLTILFHLLIALLPIILVAVGIITLYRYFSKK
ncbi:MAG: DUF1700 domain-containing protein [Lachnospiraceae bacterium]|nr:DUF1700 domain-containing protein [Lachnospiraceae bacterium]MBD5482125.1 DUF1700 domain-containing protein [Lachnospiraceae bacterium]